MSPRGVGSLLRLYGWLFAASGAAFLLAPGLVSRLLNLAGATASLPPIEQGTPTYWLALTGSMMAMIAHLAFSLANDPANAVAWRTLLLSKGVSTAAFVAFAAASGNALFLAGAAVDGTILAHLAWLCRGSADAGRSAPGYEVWFLRLRDAAKGTALWLRHAEHAGDQSRSEVWWTLYDPAVPGVLSDRLVVPRAAAEAPAPPTAPAILRFEGPATPIAPASAGTAGLRPARPARWDVALSGSGAPPFRFAPFLRGAGLACAAYEAAVPAATAEAVFAARGREWSFSSAEASVGHIRGRRGARAWRWLHARFPDPAGGPPTVVEILSALVPAWPFGWLTGVHLWHEGRHRRADGLWRLVANRSRREGEAWEVSGDLGGLRLEAVCRRDPDRIARFEYPDADGRAVRVGTSMTGWARLRLSRKAGPCFESETGGAAVEFGGEEA